CHEYGKPSIGIWSIYVRAQDRAVSHGHIGILFHKYFMPTGHGSKPPISHFEAAIMACNGIHKSILPEHLGCRAQNRYRTGFPYRTTLKFIGERSITATTALFSSCLCGRRTLVAVDRARAVRLVFSRA